MPKPKLQSQCVLKYLCLTIRETIKIHNVSPVYFHSHVKMTKQTRKLSLEETHMHEYVISQVVRHLYKVSETLLVSPCNCFSYNETRPILHAGRPRQASASRLYAIAMSKNSFLGRMLQSSVHFRVSLFKEYAHLSMSARRSLLLTEVLL